MAGGSCVLLACTSLALAIGGPGVSAWKSASELQKPDQVSGEASQLATSQTEVQAVPAVPTQGAGAVQVAVAAPKAQPVKDQYRTELSPDGTGFRVTRVEGSVESGTREVMPEPCADDALFSQRMSTYDDGGVSASYSDLEAGYTQYDNFFDVRGDISGLSWYGVFMGDDMPFGCGSDPYPFEVRFYEDANDAPGAEVAYYAVSLTGEPTEMDVGMGAYASRYTMTIDPPLIMRDGWISIVGAGEPDGCIFSWFGAPKDPAPGDGRHCTGDSAGEITCDIPGDFWAWDLNMCILGTFYPGACCDDVTGTCADGIEYVDCLPPARFEADTFCNELDPQCGQITGACCEGETCQVRTPGDCLAVGGIYKGHYVPCDPNPCVGACCMGMNVCEVYTEVDCLALGGDYKGDGTDCDPNPCPPVNDDCANAEAVSEGEWRFDATYATVDGPQVCGLTLNIWFCYTASATGTVTVTVGQDSGIYWGASCAAYEGCVCDPFPTLILCDPYGEGSISFDVQAGSQYLIEVGSLFGADEGTPGNLSVNLDAWAYGACCTEESPYCYEGYEQDCTGTFAGDGTTCSLAEDCNGSGFVDACDIATGYSQDCNGNGIPDECDISAGTSYDYDVNGVPDECGPDCNGNGIIDACDIDCNTGNCNQIVGCGESDDCQPDGVPDECQLGGAGGDEVLLWENGPPAYGDPYYYTLVSQEGGDAAGAFIVDDFYLPGPATVTTFHANFEDEGWFEWSGRVRIEVYPDNGAGGPDESGGPTALLWIPDDGGTVTRTATGGGLYADSYRYDVTGLYIELGPGIWWIGMASETQMPWGMAAWASSRSAGNVEMGEAQLRWPSFGLMNFIPASNFWGPMPWDVSFSVGTNISGADCNENLIPDDCDIAYCDGSLWCSDCNANGVPDECEIDCNGNGIPDDCDIRDCDGSPWCQDCQGNGIPDGCEPDCNANDIADECDILNCDGSLWCQDCNENGVPDGCDIASGASTDYDLNGVPDECDPDCNGNGIPDACDLNCSTGNCSAVVCGGSMDCQPDGIPDECQQYNEFEYLTDDGTREDAIGLSAGGTTGWLTHFTVAPGFEHIDAVSLTWGSVEDGLPCTIFVWSDPDNDGDPSDAQVLCSAAAVTVDAYTDNFTTVDVPDVYIGPPGTSFFVGAMMEHESGDRPAPLDEGQSQYQSWIFGDADSMVDPNDLGGAAFEVTPIDNYYSGNWLLRAIGFDNNECNGNGIPDDCDIAADPSLDCNGNIVIDACEWEDCNDNGILDACDILDCDGSPWCGDCNGNGIPDECDIAAGAADCQPNGIPDVCEDDCNGNDIPDDCDIRDCDGSIWCDDCNGNGSPDECDTGTWGGAVFEYDDGSAENSIGTGSDVELAWIQRFVAETGSETIVSISTCFGNSDGDPGHSGVSVGQEFRVFVWDDPDGDGSPQDAVLLGSTTAYVDAGSIETDVLQEVAIAPVTVSGSFFIGAAVASMAYAVPMDEDGVLAHESWVVAAGMGMGGFDPQSFYADNMDDIGYSANLLLRATSEAVAAENDCNDNGIPDDCELCGDLDADEDVDYDDYVIFLSAFGGVTDGVPAVDYCCDYDGSGAVGMADFDAWLGCYRAYVNDPLAGPPTVGKRRIRVPLSPLPKRGFSPAPSP